MISDLETLSTEELYNKIYSLNEKISAAHMLGMNPTVIEQMRSYVAQYQNTIEERAFMSEWEKDKTIALAPLDSDKVTPKADPTKTRKRVK